MAKPEFKLVEKLFHEALALPAVERTSFLENACHRDGELRSAVEELLRHAGPDDRTLAGPVADLAAQIRAEGPTLIKDTKTAAVVASWPTIPGYDVLEELGRGGMGVVYKVRQRSLHRIVALKMLLPVSSTGTEMLVRFRTEVEALARLQHPNIITIYDIGPAADGSAADGSANSKVAGTPYFTMEYIDGPSLARLLEGRAQDPIESARFVEILARTMQAVHQHGIIHRDLKPANVLLQKDEGARKTGPSERGVDASLSLSSYIPKITDFGLAKDQSATDRLTVTGVTMGTPSYMAPEQARTLTGGVGPAADIYALGSILYEMLTGQPPFGGESPVDVINQLLEDEPASPLARRPRLPVDLVTICLKCLEKSPRNRYASAVELADDLRRFQAGEPILARPVGTMLRVARWCRRRPLVAGLAAGCFFLLVGLLVTVTVYDFQLRKALARADARTEEQRQQIVQLNVYIGITELDRGNNFKAVLRFTEALRLDEGDQERERDHRIRIAHALRHSPRLQQLRVHDRPVLCTHLGEKSGWLATIDSTGAVEVDDVMTGLPVGPKLKMKETPGSAVVSADGAYLATLATNGSACVWDLATGLPQKLPCAGDRAVRHLAFHPDGKVLITRHADGTLRRWDLNARTMTMPLPLADAGSTNAVLSDDARWLFTMDDRHIGQAWNLASGKPVGSPFDLQQDVLLATISPGCRRVAFVGVDGTLRVWDLAENKLVGKAMPMKTSPCLLAFSPDAEQLLTVTGDKEIAVWKLCKSDRPCRSFEPGHNIKHGNWDRDGKRMLTMNDKGAAQILNCGSGQVLTPPLAHGGPLHSAAMHGRTLITVAKQGTVAIWELPVDNLSDMETSVPPDERSIEELQSFAQVLAGGRINEQQLWEALDPSQLQSAWEKCQAAVSDKR